jgi:D-alanine transfer protein
MSGDPSRHAAAGPGHLGPALVSVALCLVGLVSAPALAARWTRAHLDALAPVNLPQKNLGVLLQREMALAPAIIPLYGSSELVRPSEFRADGFFAQRPRGFAVSPVGTRGTPLLVTLQEIGAVGRGLAGRKVIVILSPSEFLRTESTHEMTQRQYYGNYSRLQSESVIFGSQLDLAFKQRIAERMLQFPDVLKDDPVLRFALHGLADPGRTQLAGYYLALPFGRLQVQVGRWLDAVSVLELLARRPSLRQAIPAAPNPFDWASLRDSAERSYRPRASRNPAGFEDAQWERFEARYQAQRARTTDSAYRANLAGSRFWPDLGLLLEGLKQLGAKQLILSPPLPGRFYFSYLGLSPATWEPFYKRLRALAGATGARLVTFEANNLDPFLSRDGYHPSPEAWVLLDRAIDEFSHDTLR